MIKIAINFLIKHSWKVEKKVLTCFFLDFVRFIYNFIRWVRLSLSER
jgi:hypothetical protein